MPNDDELTVMATVRDALTRLPDKGAQARVLRWATDALGVADLATAGPAPSRAGPEPEQRGLPDLIDAAQPDTRSERILVIAYWLEASTGGGDWTSQAVNDEMKNLGDAVPNITDALSSLIARKPALVRQVRKSGRAQQARKRYALTGPGRAAVVSMLRRESQ